MSGPGSPADAPRLPPEQNGAAPVSVHVGEVVAPDDPEDWRRPLTWVAALGMLAAPMAALSWFALARPTDGDPDLATRALAVVLVVGASATGATQRDALRAGAATAAAALFAALATVVVGVVVADERLIGSASPTVAQAVIASAAGIAGALGAATIAAALGRSPSRWARWLLPASVGGVVGLLVVQLLA